MKKALEQIIFSEAGDRMALRLSEQENMKYKLLINWPLVLIFLVGTSFLNTNAQTVVRGPYLQTPTSTSIIVKWRTDSVTITDSRVYYGTSLTTLTNFAVDTAQTTEHKVSISGLLPYTKYYYSVGSSSQAMSGPDSGHYFITAPSPGTVQPIRIWAIGDFGKGNDPQRRVRDSYLDYTGNTNTDVWLWLGDNVYYSGTDQEYQDKVFDSINGYHQIFKSTPFWPCPGNHDYEVIALPLSGIPPEDHTGPYYDIIDVPVNGEAGGVASGYELYYSFDYGNAHFISLNSELEEWTGASDTSFTSSPMTQWLESDLQANTKKWVIVFWHQPPYSKCSQVDSDDLWQVYVKAMRENINPILEQYGVDLVLCGHAHVYHRSYLLKGHYGYSSTFDASMKVDGTSGSALLGENYTKYTNSTNRADGTVYVVVGNSGSDDVLLAQHPAMYFADGCDTCYGSLIIDINGNRLDGRYLTSDGNILDEFTIVKVDTTFVSSRVPEVPPEKIKLYPNPFGNQTKIEYTVREPAYISLEVFDVSGKFMFKIVQENQQPGEYSYTLDAARYGLKKGAYVIRLKVNDRIAFETALKLD